ncbi:MAG TPA: Crp/Fnr family transcriptional regulator [Acidobacteria bacterium]|nr:Crp/Fnr family transcriptional regulator [Acidobacteriota bacterium]
MTIPEKPNPGGRGALSRQANCFSCQIKDRTEWCALEEDELREVNRSKVCNSYEPGQVIFYQGNPCLGIHCIEEGTVALRKFDEQGNTLLARLFHAGDTLGYLAYFSSQGYSGTAEALTACRICFVDRAAIRHLLERNPALGVRFLGRIADNLREAEDSKLRIVAVPLRARVAHLLLALRDRFATVADDGSLTLQLPLSRMDIAAMVGARPESISRVIRHFESHGIADFDGRTVKIPDLDLLLDICEEAGNS